MAADSTPSLDASSTTTATAQSYYDSSDADTFYHTIWGGTDIHIGLYNSPSDSIASASQRTVSRMASLLSPTITPSTRILDMGAGYGGAARYLAGTFGCRVTCLNLSEVENKRNRAMTEEAGLMDLIDVVQGSFQNVPLGDHVVDVVWSQDAFLHSGARERVVEEIDRVLVPGCGKVIFTDPMVAKGADSARLTTIFNRLHLDSLGSVELYRDEFQKRGFGFMGYEDCTNQLVEHYGRVLRELEAREGQLKGKISEGYVKNMKEGLNHWVEGGSNGQLTWGIMQFSRPNSQLGHSST